MAADISLAAGQPPLPGARPKLDSAGAIGIVAVTLLIFCSFGIVVDLFVIIAVKSLGAPDPLTWSAGALGAVVMFGLSAWAGYETWLNPGEPGF